MNDLINSLFQLSKVLIKGVSEGFEAVSKWMGKTWWLVVAFILTPITWLIDAATQTIEFVAEKVEWMSDQIALLGVEGIGETWSSFSYFLGLLDNFVPVAFTFFLASLLLGLWVVCTVVRVLIRLIPTAG